jgi:hypothetical protein
MATTTAILNRTTQLLALVKDGDDAFNNRDFAAMNAVHHHELGPEGLEQLMTGLESADHFPGRRTVAFYRAEAGQRGTLTCRGDSPWSPDTSTSRLRNAWPSQVMACQPSRGLPSRRTAPVLASGLRAAKSAVTL